jgi:hypothetical protein
MQEILLGRAKKTSDSVILLLHFDGTSVVEEFGRSMTLSGDAILTTAYSRFGGSSLAPRSGFVRASMDPSLVFTEDYTIEGWAYRTAGLGDTTMISSKTANTMVNQTTIGQQGDKGLGIFLTDGAGWRGLGPAQDWPLNQWVHYAVVWKNGVYTGFINGKAYPQHSFASPIGFGMPGGVLTIGGNEYNGASQFPGYMDEVCFSSGAKYIGDFTPPSAPFSL